MGSIVSEGDTIATRKDTDTRIKFNDVGNIPTIFGKPPENGLPSDVAVGA